VSRVLLSAACAGSVAVVITVSAACSHRRPVSRPLEQAPIGLEAGSETVVPSPLEAPGPSGRDAGTPLASAPDPSCALPLRCDAAPAAATFSVTLERAPCFGKCPVYLVTIDSRGNVSWLGRDFVDFVGSTTLPGDPKRARALVERILGACYFEMKDEYQSSMTDTAWANTTVTVGNRTKTIRHRLGDTIPDASETSTGEARCSAPAALTELENAIDEAANTARWIGQGGRASTTH
jgi:hypothetical protein